MNKKMSLKDKKIELKEIGSNEDLLDIVIENDFWLKYKDVKKAALDFKYEIMDLDDDEMTQGEMEIKYRLLEKYNEFFGDFEQ